MTNVPKTDARILVHASPQDPSETKYQSPMDAQPSKRRKHIPWWVYLFLAFFFYAGCKYILPGLASDAVSQQQLTEAGNLAAPIIAIVFLLLAANNLFKDVPPPKSDADPSSEDGEDMEDKEDESPK